MRLRDVVGHGIYASAQAMLSRALQGESTAFDRLVPGAGGVKRWMTIRVVPDATPDGRGARRVRADERHPRPEAGAGSLARERGRAAADHGQRAGARRLHRSRLSLPLPQPAQRGMAVGEPQGPDRHGRSAKSSATQRARAVAAAADARARRATRSRPSSCWCSPTASSAGNRSTSRPIATPRATSSASTRCTPTSTTRSATRKRCVAPTGCCRRTSTTRRWRCSSGTATFVSSAGRRRRRTSSAGAPTRCWACPSRGSQLTHESDREQVVELMNKLMAGDEPRATGLNRNYRKDGETIWCEWYHSCLLDEQGRIVSILSFVQDVSSRIQAEERLQYLATRDALTGLPNRLLLQERLTQAIAQAKRSDRRVGVLFIDLDRFKNVNDTLGHRIGDELLKRVTACALERLARDRPAGAPRRRRVHGHRRGFRRSGRAQPRRAEAAGGDRAAVRDRGARHLRDVVDRHRGLSRRQRRSRGPAQARRRGDVPLEGARPQHLSVLRCRPGRAAAQAAHAGKSVARRGQGRRADAALSAGRPHHRSHHRRRRGAAALERSRSTARWRRRCSFRWPRSRD